MGRPGRRSWRSGCGKSHDLFNVAVAHFVRGEFPSEHLFYMIAVLCVTTHHGWSQVQVSEL